MSCLHSALAISSMQDEAHQYGYSSGNPFASGSHSGADGEREEARPPPRPSQPPSSVPPPVTLISYKSERLRQLTATQRLKETLRGPEIDADLDYDVDAGRSDLPNRPDPYLTMTAREILCDFMCHEEDLLTVVSGEQGDDTAASPTPASPRNVTPPPRPNAPPSSIARAQEHSAALSPLPSKLFFDSSQPAVTQTKNDSDVAALFGPGLPTLKTPTLWGSDLTKGRSPDYYKMKENSLIVAWAVHKTNKPEKRRQRHEKRRRKLESRLYEKFHLDSEEIEKEQHLVGQGKDDTETPKFLQNVENLKAKKKKERKKDKKKKTDSKLVPAPSPAPRGKKDEYLILLVGDKGVGKTALLNAYLKGTFTVQYKPTRFEIHTAQVSYQNETGSVEFWDTCSDADYEKRLLLSFKTAQVIILCFSMINYKSYCDLYERWIEPIRQNVPRNNVPVLLVGTRQDEVGTASAPDDYYDESSASKYAQKLDAHEYFTCSAKTGDGVQAVFAEAIKYKWEKFVAKPEKEKSVAGQVGSKVNKVSHQYDKFKDK